MIDSSGSSMYREGGHLRFVADDSSFDEEQLLSPNTTPAPAETTPSSFPSLEAVHGDTPPAATVTNPAATPLSPPPREVDSVDFVWSDDAQSLRQGPSQDLTSTAHSPHSMMSPETQFAWMTSQPGAYPGHWYDDNTLVTDSGQFDVSGRNGSPPLLSPDVLNGINIAIPLQTSLSDLHQWGCAESSQASSDIDLSRKDGCAPGIVSQSLTPIVTITACEDGTLSNGDVEIVNGSEFRHDVHTGERCEENLFTIFPGSSHEIRRGIGPDQRNQVNEQILHSLSDSEDINQLAARNEEVEEWLSSSETTSQATGPTLTSYGDDSLHTGILSDHKVDLRGYSDPRQDDLERMLAARTHEPYKSGQPSPDKRGRQEMDDCELSRSDSLPNFFSAFRLLESSETERVPQQTSPDYGVDPIRRGSHHVYRKFIPGLSSADSAARFLQQAKDIETSSLTATMGSRKDSIDVYVTEGSNRALGQASKAPSPPTSTRRLSIFDTVRENFQSKKGDSSRLKRKSDNSSSTMTSTEPTAISKISTGTTSAPSHAGPRQYLRVNTPTRRAVSNQLSPTIVTLGQSRSRNRSLSDGGIARESTPCLMQLLRVSGGPPVAVLGTAMPCDSQDEAFQRGLEAQFSVNCQQAMAFAVGTVSSTIQNDFLENTKRLNPLIPEALLQRLAKEHMLRWTQLADWQEASWRSSPYSKLWMFPRIGEYRLVPPAPKKKKPEQLPTIFQVRPPAMDVGFPEEHDEYTVHPAQIPQGVPYPPVPRLPAEFLCPLCYQEILIGKPSDWTKHVHEDVQPFTCTYPDCDNARSFKRKADWIRHQNERHRRTEYWRCNQGNCRFLGYRKNNFVQHLVREHRFPDPKTRSNDGQILEPLVPSSRNEEDRCSIQSTASSNMWTVVKRCYGVVTRAVMHELCPFCNEPFSHDGKLDAHVAKHMEQIALPVLKQLKYGRTSWAALDRSTNSNSAPVDPFALDVFDTSPVDVAGSSSGSLAESSTGLCDGSDGGSSFLAPGQLISPSLSPITSSTPPKQPLGFWQHDMQNTMCNLDVPCFARPRAYSHSGVVQIAATNAVDNDPTFHFPAITLATHPDQQFLLHPDASIAEPNTFLPSNFGSYN